MENADKVRIKGKGTDITFYQKYAAVKCAGIVIFQMVKFIQLQLKTV